MTQKNNVCAVVITFNPIVENFTQLLKNLKNQTDYIVVVDNNSKNIEVFSCFLEGYAELIPLKENLGIATAHNIAIRKAIEKGSNFALVFDQDSQIGQNFVEMLLEDYFVAQSVNNNPIAVIGPKLYNPFYDFYYKSSGYSDDGAIIPLDLESEKIIYPVMVISSGSLFNLKIFEKVGDFKDELFIDSVDTEWCFRAIKSGFLISQSNRVVMDHMIGEYVFRIGERKLHIHKPFRRYYIIRNLFFMTQLNYVPRIYFFKILLDQIFLQILLIIFTKNRLENFKALYWSIFDSLQGRLGKNPHI